MPLPRVLLASALVAALAGLTAVPAAAEGRVVVVPDHGLPGDTVTVAVEPPCEASAVEVRLRYTDADDRAGRTATAAAEEAEDGWHAQLTLPDDLWQLEGAVKATARCGDQDVAAGEGPFTVDRFPGLVVRLSTERAAPGQRVEVEMSGCRGKLVNATFFDSAGRALWLGSDTAKGRYGYEAPTNDERGWFEVPDDARPGPGTLGLACTQMGSAPARLTVLPGGAAPAATEGAHEVGVAEPAEKHEDGDGTAGWVSALVVLLVGGVLVARSLDEPAAHE